MDYDFLLQDRIQKIQQIVSEYGENKFLIAFSGGKDSTILSKLIDIALPENRIPRVFADTGIELNAIREFAYEKQKEDDRVVIITPTLPIKQILEEYGYPFKSKDHAKRVGLYQRNGWSQAVDNYLATPNMTKKYFKTCPKMLLYQFTEDFTLKVSDKCCFYLKEKPLQDWGRTHKRPITITGIVRAEGGRRENSKCLSYHNNKLQFFQPLAPMTEDWEAWFVDKYKIQLCKLYYPPYNFTRSGCKGCPFALRLQDELDTLEKFFPAEKKQCEIIWKPVYDEYRRLGYRLKSPQISGQMNLFEDFLC